jgi:hypothetical protein
LGSVMDAELRRGIGRPPPPLWFCVLSNLPESPDHTRCQHSLELELILERRLR